MSFINPDDYEVSFSEPTVLGLGGEISCENACPQTSVDSGQFTLINTCSMPITITGFHMQNPKQFSLFNHEKYKDLEIYETGSVEELPITIKPKKKISINTFFHPEEEELRYGKAGTIENRDGDKFSSKVEIYPGFKITNCNNSECDASFILTGEFLCIKEDYDFDWLENRSNFNQEFNASLLEVYTPPSFENKFFLRKKTTHTYINTQEDNTSENYFSGISGALESYANYFNQNSWFETYSDFGITGTLHGVFLAVSGLKENGQDNSRANLYEMGFEHTVEVNDFTSYQTKFSTEDYEEVNYDGEDYVVLKVENKPIESIDLMTNQSLFLREINPPGSIEMFLCDEGDFQNEEILES